MAKKILEEIELGPSAAAGARRALKRLEPDVSPEVLEDVRLLVSELITNSYRHSGSPPGDTATLTVNVKRGRILVDVGDHGRGFVPSLPEQTPLDRPSGWGLTIVDRVADRWGVTRDHGTHVWFELVTQPLPARTA